MQEKGHCKHGEFELMRGCLQCMTERRQAEESTGNAPATLSSSAGDSPTPEIILLEPKTALALRPGEDIEAHGYFQEACKLLAWAEGRVIATAEDEKGATNDLAQISKVKKAMDEKRKGYLAPLKEKTEAIRATYDCLMSPILEAEKITRDKMTNFKLDQERKAKEVEELNRQAIELARKQAAINNGEFTVDTTPVVVPTTPKLTRTEQGTSGLVASWKYRIIDIDKLPCWCMVPDDAMLKSTAKQHHDKKPIPGVEFYNDPYIATRPR